MRIDTAEWNAATTRVVWCAALFAAATLAVPPFAGASAEPGEIALRAGIGIGANAAVWIMLGSLLGLLLTGLFWTVTVVRLSRIHRAPAAGHAGFWAFGVFAVSLPLSFLAAPALGAWGVAAVRAAGAAVLIAGVLHTRAWFRRRGEGAIGYSLVTGGASGSPLSPHPTADDWDTWDPAVQEEIERRRHRGQP